VDSKATVVVGDANFELRAACYEADGELTVVGEGTDPGSGKPIKGMIRGPSAAYVGLMFGNDEYIYEADANADPTLERDGNRLAGDGITFVRDIDLDSAEGSPAGTGSVLVECKSIKTGTAPSPLPSR
jgi:hypothetical protein